MKMHVYIRKHGYIRSYIRANGVSSEWYFEVMAFEQTAFGKMAFQANDISGMEWKWNSGICPGHSLELKAHCEADMSIYVRNLYMKRQVYMKSPAFYVGNLNIYFLEQGSTNYLNRHPGMPR